MKGIALKSIFLAVAALCIMLFLEDQIWPREHILDESSLGWIFFSGCLHLWDRCIQSSINSVRIAMCWL